ncbi:MAG: hypothetical protein ABI082_03550 [Dokdonella sp.]
MSNYVIHRFTKRLPSRVKQLLLLAVALLATGATIVAFAPRANTARSAVSVPVAVPLPITGSPPTLLPTVLVTPDPEITTLATITVRPEPALPASTNSDSVSNFAPDANDAARNPHARSASASGGTYAMPYYSFSRSPRHANKE